MKDKSINFFSNLLIFFAISLVGLVINIIFYEWLQTVFPSDTTFLGMPFNLPTFMFGLTFISFTAFIAIIIFYFPKNKKRINKIKNTRDII